MTATNPSPSRHADRIAQVILEKALIPDIEIVTSLPQSTKGSQGFGSTEEKLLKPVPPKPIPLPPKFQDLPPSAAAAKMTAPDTNDICHNLPTLLRRDSGYNSDSSDKDFDDDDDIPPYRSPTRQYLDDPPFPVVHNILTDAEPPFQVSLSTDHIDNTVVIDVPITGNDPLLGFSLVKK